MSLAFLDYTPIVEIKLGPLAVSPHGIGTAVGFLAGAKLLLGATRRLGIPDEHIHTALTRAIVAALIGARASPVDRISIDAHVPRDQVVNGGVLGADSEVVCTDADHRARYPSERSAELFLVRQRVAALREPG